MFPSKNPEFRHAQYLKIKDSPEYKSKKRDWYLKNREKISRKNKAKRVLHPRVLKTEEEKRAKRKAWEVANKDRLTEKQRAWVEKNKERVKQYHKEYDPRWYKKNKEKHDARGKEWGQKAENKKKRVRYVQKYVVNNREKVRQYAKEFQQTLHGKYRTLYYRAKHFAGTPITLEEYSQLMLKNCIYCGINGKLGIDRMDNSVGYTKENSAPCCTLCNFMKKAMSVEGFLSHVDKIYLFNHA